jgi:hypothetical protein
MVINFASLVDESPLLDLMECDRALQSSFEAMQRSIQSADALGQLQELSPENFRAAVGPVMSALTAGTTMDLEGFTYSQEAMSVSAMGVLKAIGRAIAEFFKAVLDFLTSLDLAAIWLGRKVSVLAKAVPTTSGMQATVSTITMGRQAKFLRVGAKYIREANRLEQELRYLQKTIDVISGTYTHSLLETATHMPGAVRGKSGDMLELAMVELIEKIKFDKVAEDLDMQSAPQERFNRANVRVSKPLLGGHSIFYLQSDLLKKGVSGFTFHGLMYEKTTSSELKIDSHVDFDVLRPNQIGHIPEILKSVLGSLSSASNLPVRTAINHAKSSLNNLTNNMEGTEHDVSLVRRTVSALTYWMGNPSRMLYSNSMSVVRASIAYCEDSIKTYK